VERVIAPARDALTAAAVKGFVASGDGTSPFHEPIGDGVASEVTTWTEARCSKEAA
jgi:hypothetical protein